MTVLPDIHHILRVTVAMAAGLAAGLAAYYSLRSAMLAASLARSLPFGDEWDFVRDYFKYLEGSYRFLDLFNQHNEHRLATTRVILFLDAWLFDLKGHLTTIVHYAVLLLIAMLMARMALGRSAGPGRLTLGCALALGLTWSISQFINLSSPFQVSFPLVHLFALLCYQALALALTERQPIRWLWLIVACGSDFMAAFSMASGIFIVIPAVAMAIWLRRLDRTFLFFLAFHAVILAMYLWNYSGGSYRAHQPAAWMAYAEFVAWFVGWFFGGWHHLQARAGMIGLVAFFAAAVVSSWAAIVRRSPIDRAACVFLALAGFVLVEAIAASYARARFGLTARYATASVVFAASLLGFGWRMTHLSNNNARDALRLLWLAVTVVGLVGANVQHYESVWKTRVARLDKAAFAFIGGVFPEEQLKLVFRPRSIEADIKKLASLGLGLFAPSANAYRPPLNTLAGLHVDALPACRHHVEHAPITDREWVELRGWVADPAGPEGPDWILAFADGGRLVGYTRAGLPRPDVATALSLDTPNVGFGLFLTGNAIGADRPATIRLVAITDRPRGRRGARACAVPFTFVPP